MSNPTQQAPGYVFTGPGASQPSGLISTIAQTGTCTTATSTALTVMTFNPQTTGPAAGPIQKGSLAVLGAGGHGSDIVASVTSSTAVALLTATSASTAGVALQIYNFPALISGEASAITAANTLLSSYFVGSSGQGGVVNQTDLANALYGDVVFIAGAAFTPAAGGYIALWFLQSYDGGSTFEKNVANTANPRPADVIIPLFASAYAAGDRAYSRGVIWPATPTKILFQNNSGATMPATWGIWALPESTQLTN